jgi:hypothetical protein
MKSRTQARLAGLLTSQIDLSLSHVSPPRR